MQKNLKPFGTKIKVNTNFVLGRLKKKKKKWRNWSFSSFMYVVVVVYFTTFESVILYRNTHRPCYVSKAVIGAVFKSYELLHF